MSRTILTSLTMVFSILLATVSMTSTAMETKTVILEVPGMNCKFCPITIRKSLEKVPGVIEAKADYDTKTATVIFDPNKTNVESLTTATTNAGYPSTIKQK